MSRLWIRCGHHKQQRPTNLSSGHTDARCGDSHIWNAGGLRWC